MDRPCHRKRTPPMLIAATASLQLFAPVIIIASTSMAVLAAQRLLMSRKVHVARASSDPLLDLADAEFPIFTPPEPATPTRFVESPIAAIQPAIREDEVTLHFVRGRRVPSPADSASMTLRSERVYLEVEDLIAC